MEKKFRLLLLLALLMTAATGAWAQEQWDVVWDFTAWSTETVTALKADAAASKTEGWSDVEKEADAMADADPTEAAKDNCFWFAGTVNEDGSLSANGAVIKELKGLKFNSDYAAKRSLAIAVNYQKALSDYAGPAYLYLGGSKQTCFTIPGVKAGSKITIEVESHKTSSARGIGLYKNSYAAGNLIGEQFTPTTLEAKTWEIAEDCDVVVYNTNNCHIYTIKVKAPAAAPSSGYTVSMKSDVKDADEWTVKVGEGQAQALPIGGLNEGDAVTLQYNGRLKVKGVKATSDAAPAANIVDLSKLTENTELKDGDVLTGTLGANVKISIADGATVTLDGATINGVNDTNYEWAGITCLGDATIILSGTNTVKGFKGDYPGIQAAAGKTLIINGTGSLTASSYGWGAGIGGGSGSGAACGNIEIQGGTINATSVEYGAGIGGGNNSSWGNITISGGTVTATGGWRGAGIGGGRKSSNGSVSCGNILISGGTITATGGEDAAGIGGGRGYNNNTFGSCGTITITTGVTKVTATMGDGATNSIGAGKYCNCGTVTIGGNVGAISESPYTYQP